MFLGVGFLTPDGVDRGMSDSRPALKDLIRDRRLAEKLSQSDLATKVGTNQQTIEKIESGITKRSGFLPQILHVLKIDMDYLTQTPSLPNTVAVEPAADRDPRRENILQGPVDLPVHGAAEGGRGAIIVSTDPIEYVARPQPLLSVRSAYGIIIVEDSMSPEFEPGQIALVHPHLPAQVGATCIFYSKAEDGTDRAIIKRLRRVTADSWHVRQWNPPEGGKQDFTLKRSEWQICHVTVGRYDKR